MGIIIFKGTMARGTPAQGGRRTKSHGLSRVTGQQNFHRQKGRDSGSGLGAHNGGKMLDTTGLSRLRGEMLQALAASNTLKLSREEQRTASDPDALLPPETATE